MEPIRILLLKPDSEDPSPVDQSLGARLAAAHVQACSDIKLEEASFCDRDFADLEKTLDRWRKGVSAVVGATGVPESTRLGKLAQARGLLCFVANNNPAVWRGRREVFHIGLPSAQTAGAVAGHLQRRNCRRIALVHDQTEFQLRVAASMESALKASGAEVISCAQLADDDLARLSEWPVDLVYVVFSSEPKALPMARRIRAGGVNAPLLFGRSLLRESFLTGLGAAAGESWFVDMFSRVAPRNRLVEEFFETLAVAGIAVPTANHAFGWDGVSFCALALKAAEGDPARAIAQLESAVPLEGVTGTCVFTADNHNGRSGVGPTIISRWHAGRFEDL